MTDYDSATSSNISLSYLDADRFGVRLDMVVDFHGFIGVENPEFPLFAETEIEYMKLIISPENLFPKPLTPQEVNGVTEPFVALSAYGKLVENGRQFILQPNG